MAVFLLNQCTFSKLPDDQQTAQNISNGASPNNQNSNDSTASVGVGPLSSSNICGFKFDSLFELIHHIEDNHISDVDYQTTPNAVAGPSGPFYHGHQLSASPAGGLVAPAPARDSNVYNVIPHDRHHMTQIINGFWLPTSCILRIFNSTHKPHKPPQPQPQPQQQTHQQLQQPPTPQPISIDMGQQSPQICTGPASMDIGNSHHIVLASPNILNGASFHVTSNAITTTQSNIASSPAVVNQAPAGQQQINVNYSIQHPQLQLQQTQQPQTQPQQQPQQQPQTQPQQQPMLQSPQISAMPKPTKVYKCGDCNKTYKTVHGLRTHQNTHHPNSPQTDGKIMAVLPEGGDTPSGSPAPLSQQQPQPQQQQQQQPTHQQLQQPPTPQPISVDMAQLSPQICSGPASMDSGNSHHIVLASPNILNGASFHVTSNAITTTQSNIASSPAVVNQAPAGQQQINVNYSIQHPQLQLQQTQQPQTQPQQQPQTQPQQQPMLQSPQITAMPTTIVHKPTQVYKCGDCSKTYKTMHGLRTHQNTHHQNTVTNQ